MIKTTTKSLLLTAALTLSFPLYATEAVKTETPAQSETILAAHTLLKTMKMDDTYKKMIQNITTMQIKQNPQLEPLKPTMMAFFEKYMGWDALKDDMAKVYANNYTAKELKELNTFYQTPVGQKTVELMPKIAAEGMQVGQAKVTEHMGELQEMIQKELIRIQAEKESIIAK